MSLLLKFFFLFLFFVSSSTNAKFYFNFHSNSLKLPSCSLSGVKTIHLPDPSHPTTQSTNIRLHFPSPPSSSNPSSLNFEAFSSSAERIFRLELAFLHDHVQINWNGLVSPWHSIQNHHKQCHNYLEVRLSPATTAPKFKLNGNAVSVKVREPVTRPVTFKLTYDEFAVPDSDWLELVTDPEILNSLQTTPPTWQPPLISTELLKNDDETRGAVSSSLVDYIVYDCESFTQLQISSGRSLPKVTVKKSKKSINLFLKFKLNIFKKSLPLPIVYGTKKQANTRILGTIVISAFIIYLVILLHLSKMTSIRPGTNNKKFPTEPLKQQSQQLQHVQHSQSQSQSQSRSLSQSQLKLPTTVNPFKSTSRTILIDLPDAPLFKASLSTSGSVLKVSVPAAFSLADNRHILFPSKLRK